MSHMLLLYQDFRQFYGVSYPNYALVDNMPGVIRIR